MDGLESHPGIRQDGCGVDPQNLRHSRAHILKVERALGIVSQQVYAGGDVSGKILELPFCLMESVCRKSLFGYVTVGADKASRVPFRIFLDNAISMDGADSSIGPGYTEFGIEVLPTCQG